VADETEIDDWISQMRRGLLELSVLALLDGEASYGYEIVSRLAVVAQLASGEGTVYPLLRRLRREGLLEAFWQESASGPPRQYYRLTPAGRSTLNRMRRQWRELGHGIDQLLDRRETRS
jgi:PadR family transcriptional regulator PadR